MTRVGLVLLLISSLAIAGADGKACPFCAHVMEKAKAPDPWTRAFSCPSCRARVQVFSDGTESGSVVRNGRREVYVIDPHAASRPDHPVARPAHAVKRPDHAVTRPAHPVRRSKNHPVSRLAHPVKRPAHAVRRGSHAVGRTHHPVRRARHAVTRPTHAVLRPGHSVTRPGHALGVTSRGVRKPMYAEHRPRAKTRTYAEAYRGRAKARTYAKAYRR